MMRGAALAFAVVAASSSAAPRAPIAPAFTGRWLDAPQSSAREAERIDGHLLICSDGRATYVVVDNQLIYELTARHGSSRDRLDLYYASGDHGTGFMRAPLAEPPVGTRVATIGRATSTTLTIRYRNAAFVNSVRQAVPSDLGTRPFPPVFVRAPAESTPTCGR